MENNKSKEEIRKKMKIIQNKYPEIFEVMASPETAEIIEKIAIDYGLQSSDEVEKPLKQGQELTDIASHKIAKIIGQILLGSLVPTELAFALKKELNIEAEMAEKITKEINQKLFTDIKLSLHKLYNIKEISPPLIKKPLLEEQQDTYREPIE